MSDDQVGRINFGPARTTDKIEITATPIKISASTPLVIRCLVSECPNNKGYACQNHQVISIGLNGKCLFGDDARKHAREKGRHDVNGTP